MLIIDGDYPMAVGALHWDRDHTWDLGRIRTAEEGTVKNGAWPDAYTMASLPEMRKARMAAALVKLCSCVKRPGHAHGEYRTQNLAYASSMGQLAYYQLLESLGEASILATSESFSSLMETWESAESFDDLRVGLVIGMEGADAVVWPEQVHEWWEKGLRVVSLSHYGVSAYSHGTATGTDGGLLPPAEALLREMDSLGMILDVTHTSDASVREELEVFEGPVLASHQNCRAVTPGERQQPDDILMAVIERGGVIGASMDTWMIYKGGTNWSGHIPSPWEVFPRESVTLEDYVDHIDYVCQLAGNSLHAAIGGDTDGQGGVPEAPYEIDTVVDYMKVADVLAGRGYSTEDVENVMYRNWQRFFETWLPSEKDL